MSDTAQQIETDDGPGTVDDKGRLVITLGDGGLLIRRDWKGPRDREHEAESKKHTANLAIGLTETSLAALADDLMRGIDADIASRSDWMEGLANATEMLALRTKKSTGSADDSAAPLEGMSVFDHPLLLQSTIRFQADFVAEMLPSDGPVKVRSDEAQGPPGSNQDPPGSLTTDDRAEALQRLMNHYLTTTATEYYPDTTRMSFGLGYKGGGFKKVYDCPLRKRPVSESVALEDLIVDHSATDIQNASLVGRVTHRIKMQNAMLRRLTKAKLFRDVPLQDPREDTTAVERAEARAQGLADQPMLSADHPHTIYECSTGLDPADVGDGDDDGIYRPYKVTIEKDSRVILAIRRNWREGDEQRMPRREYVKYSYIDGLGFYPIGLYHILGNTVKALTAAFRLFLDAGMLANFPGFLYSDVGGKQMTNQFRVPPGGGAPINTGSKPISDIVMPLPYRSPDAPFMAFIQHLEESGKALGGEVSAPLNEGTANMPVGTMLASIEQAVKPLKGVFKGLHRSQAEEFQLLRDRFRENPEALLRSDKSQQWELDELTQALEDHHLVPMADPNTASQVQRIAIAGALEQLTEKAPTFFKVKDVLERLMRMLGVPDGDSLLDSDEAIQQKLAAQAQQGAKGSAAADPALTQAKVQESQAKVALTQAQTQQTTAQTQGVGADLQDKAADRQAKAAALVVESQDRAADRQSHLQIAQMRLDSDKTKTGAGLVKSAAEGHADQMATDQQHAHEAAMQARDQGHEQGMAVHDAAQTAAEGEAQRAHQAGMADQQAQQSSADAGEQRQHEIKVAGMSVAAKKKSEK